MQRLKEGSKHSDDTALHSSVPLTTKSSASLELCMLSGQKGSQDSVRKMVGTGDCFEIVLHLWKQFGIKHF